MNLIANVDRNWAIGKNNKLLVRIPDDMKFFRQTTTGKVVVMGRKTLESFPGGMPLKNRTNLVLTSDPGYRVKDAVVLHSMEELRKELEKYPDEDVFVIGGESVYRQLLPLCDVAHITKTDGRSRPTARSRPISTWNIIFINTNERSSFHGEFYL